MKWWWIAAGAGLRGSAKAGRAVSEGMAQAGAARRLSKLPRAVQQRGYLAPGDPPVPPGFDVPDFRGTMPYRDAVGRSATGSGAVPIGALLDIDRNAPGQPFSLPLDRFYQHMAVVAPPGKGKTFGLLAPLATRLARAGATVIALDVTGDMKDQIMGFARETPGAQRTQVAFYHWSIHPRHGQHSWNPLHGVDPDDTVALEGIKAAIVGDEPADERHKIFHERERRVLGGLIRLVLLSERVPTLAHVAELATNQSRLQRTVARFPRVQSSVADVLQDVSELWALQNQLEPFTDPAVRAVTEKAELDLADIVHRRSIVIVGAELELRERAKAAASLFVNRLTSVLQGRYGHSEGVPVVLLVDEAPQIADRIRLDSILATARASRTGVVFAAQNVAQFGDERTAAKLFDSCDTMMLLRGSAEATVMAFQGRLGQRTVERVSFGQDAAGWNRNFRTETSAESVPMVGARELIDPPFSQYCAFLHSRTMGASPIVVDLARGLLSV